MNLDDMADVSIFRDRPRRRFIKPKSQKSEVESQGEQDTQHSDEAELKMTLAKIKPNLLALIGASVIIGLSILVYTEVLVSISSESEKRERIPTEFNLVNLSLNTMHMSTVISSPSTGLLLDTGDLPAVIFHNTSLMMVAAVAWNMSTRLEIGEIDLDTLESDYVTLKGNVMSFANNGNLMMMDTALNVANEMRAKSAIIDGKLLCETDTTYNPRAYTEGVTCTSPARVLDVFEDPLDDFGRVESFDVSGRFVAVTDAKEMRIYAVGPDEQRLIFRVSGEGSVSAKSSAVVAFAYNGRVFRYFVGDDVFREVEGVTETGTLNAIGFRIFVENGRFVECLDNECEKRNVVEIPVFSGDVRIGLDKDLCPLLVFKDERRAIRFRSTFQCREFDEFSIDVADDVDDVRILPHQSQLVVLRKNRVTYALL